MTTLCGDNNMDLALERMARVAVDRSQGQLGVLYLGHFGSDDLLAYIADRTRILRCLHLISAYDITSEGLVTMLSKFPQLEELDITLGPITEERCKLIGKACPQLKCFRLNAIGNRLGRDESDEDALGIANNMPELRRLQIVGNILTNKGPNEILDKCVHLEYLDLRCCFKVSLDPNLREKNARELRTQGLLMTRTDDHGFIAEDNWREDYYPYGYSDVEMTDSDGDSEA